MPMKVGIQDFPSHQQAKSWMPTFVGMTRGSGGGNHRRLKGTQS
jgi:hypothetical protein